MKLTRIVKIRVIKCKSRKFCWALISALLISSILTSILEPVQTFLTPKNINYKLSFFPFTLYFSPFTKAKAKVYNISSSSFTVVAVRSNVSSVLFSFEFFCMQCWNKFVPVVTTNCVLIALISFIMKLYLLFHVNFFIRKSFSIKFALF